MFPEEREQLKAEAALITVDRDFKLAADRAVADSELKDKQAAVEKATADVTLAERGVAADLRGQQKRRATLALTSAKKQKTKAVDALKKAESARKKLGGASSSSTVPPAPAADDLSSD